MIEDIEHLRPELQVEAFGDFRILGDREIGVQEGRSGDGVAPEGPRMAGAGNNRIDVEVFVCWVSTEWSAAKRARYRECSKRCLRSRWNYWRSATGGSI